MAPGVTRLHHRQSEELVSRRAHRYIAARQEARVLPCGSRLVGKHEPIAERRCRIPHLASGFAKHLPRDGHLELKPLVGQARDRVQELARVLVVLPAVGPHDAGSRASDSVWKFVEWRRIERRCQHARLLGDRLGQSRRAMIGKGPDEPRYLV